MDVELNSHSLEGPGGGGDRAGGGDTLTTAWRSHGSQKTGQRLQNTVTRSQKLGEGLFAAGQMAFFSDAEAEAQVLWSSDATHWKSP